MITPDPIQLTRDLVSLPSYEQEAGAAEYIANYLEQIGGFELTRQTIVPGRYNLIARTPGPPKLLLAGHMDTVVPKQGSRDPLAPTVDDDRLYGLGAYDMKGGIAAILAAVAATGAIPGLQLLFYCDEEYDFAGMRTFIAQEPSGPRPRLALIAEPSDLQIWNTHRGLIELRVAVGGRTGHAANPAAGLNAITGLAQVIEQLRDWLGTFASPALGTSSLNVAYLRGGLNRGKQGEEVVLGQDGNNIADYAEAVLDIRPATPELRAPLVAKQFRTLAKTAGLTPLQATTKHDLGTLYTDPAGLARLEAATSTGYLDGRAKGYGDGQLLAEAWGVPVANLGPSGGNAHAPDEWVDPASLVTLAQTYARIIQTYCA